jgi:hypothetical protein
MLGSQPANEDIHTSYIASRIFESPGRTTAFDAVTGNNGHKDGDLEKLFIRNAVKLAGDDEEALVDIKGRTVFLRDELGRPVLRDYVIRGFLKESWRANKAIKGSLSKELKAGVSTIDRFLFVEGAGTHRDKRYLVINLPYGTGTKLPLYERPLKAQTALGPRVALASSEVIPEKSYFDFRLININPAAISQEILEEWLNYGRWVGLGQWRTGSHGRFSYKLRPYEGKTIFHEGNESDDAGA